jgi:hypothetical protein
MRKLAYTLFSLSFFFYFTSSVRASDFNTDAKVFYNIDSLGEALVTYEIEIENATETALSKGYILSLTHIEPQNIQVFELEEPLFPEIVANDIGANIIINFQKPINGVGKKKQIKITFSTTKIAEKSGEIWEIFIPKLARAEDFRKYDVTVLVPKEFGDEGYVMPQPSKSEEKDNLRVYEFNRDIMSASGISAAFGESQIYSFNLSYHLKNSSWRKHTQSIALPPDTSVQKVYIDKIVPKPDQLSLDDDGNWLAYYELSPFAKSDIEVKGSAQVFASPRKLFVPKSHTLHQNTESSDYWQSEDVSIKKLAEELKTPEAIYHYVVSTLSYDYLRATPDVKRRGAVDALQNPTNAICMEFTDLFIAISRAAGIPAREVNGFAYSENPKIQPLSLVADVLHSWPEYWDKDRQIWIPIDPTWGDTTGGVDYFNKFDLKHVAFVIHGKSDSYPIPAGAYKSNSESQKDVYVALSKLEKKEVGVGSLEIKYVKKWPAIFKNKWEVKIINSDNTAMYDQTIDVYFDEEFYQTIYIDTLLPGANAEFLLESPIGFLAGDSPKSIALHSSGGITSIPLSTVRTAFVQAILVFVLLVLILSAILLIFRKKV